MTEEQKEQIYNYLREKLSDQIYTAYHIHKLVDILPMLLFCDMKEIFQEMRLMAEAYLKIIDEEKP